MNYSVTGSSGQYNADPFSSLPRRSSWDDDDSSQVSFVGRRVSDVSQDSESSSSSKESKPNAWAMQDRIGLIRRAILELPPNESAMANLDMINQALAPAASHELLENAYNDANDMIDIFQLKLK